MKKYLSFFAILITLPIFNTYAEDIIPLPTTPDPVNINLIIKNNTGSIYDQAISVNACNSNNGTTSDLKVTAYCAILQSGVPSNWNWSWPPGAFLNSLNNIAGYTSKDLNNADVYHYWSWSLNGGDGSTGLNEYVLQPNDLITLTFIDPIPPTPEPEVIFNSQGGGNGGILTSDILVKSKQIFDIKKAYEFLISQQKENGSFGADLYTDWVSVAIATTSDYQTQKDKLIKCQKELKIENYQLTDYERHVMSLMALGINPYDVNGENYIEKITKEFDGEQFGNKEEDNDDIFALIVLQNAGYKEDEEMIKKTISFILSKQKENGSWDNNIDMTGVALQSIVNIAEKNCFILGSLSGLTSPALTLDPSVCEIPQNKEFSSALSKAREFLKQNQKDDGGFGNVSSTAWAMEGIISLGENVNDWTKNGNTPSDYLGTNQDIDGGIKENDINTKIWQTSYVLSALSGKTWNQIMQKFETPSLSSDKVKTIIIEPEIKAPIVKPEIKKETKKITKIQNIAKKNIASPVNAINQIQEEKTIPKQNWFRRLISAIFGI